MLLCGIGAYENNGARTRFCSTHLMDIDFLTQEVDSTNVISDVGPAFSLLVSRKPAFKCEVLEKLDKHYLSRLIQFISHVANMYL